MLRLWEYLYRPDEIFSVLARAGATIIPSYCPTDLIAAVHEWRGMGSVNDFSTAEFLALAARHGYHATIRLQ
jgi:hypothetical protein